MSSVPKNRRVNAPASVRGPLRRFHAALALALLLASLSLSINAVRVSSQARSAEEKVNSPAQPKSKNAFDGERAFAHVRRLVGFGPRPAGSKELAEARKYIVGELKSYGLKVSEDEFTPKTPVGERRMVNVTAELPGDTTDFIIISSHYDTKPFKEFRFVGANDGGSSTGELLELARVLAAGPRTHFTYRFVFFDGEEAFCRDWDECGKPGSPDNTYGSRHYVERLKESGELKRLRALVLLDMMGYEKLEMGRDDMSTPWMAETVWRAARELGYTKQFADRTEGVGGDDHEAFLKAGVPSLDIIQLNTYPFWHTPADTLDKISARSLQTVGDVLLASLPRIEARLQSISEQRSKPFEVKTDKSEGVVFPAEYGKVDECRNSRGKLTPCERWTPGEDDVARMEQKIGAYLESANAGTRILQRLTRYKRQYVGFVRDGRRKIWVNAFVEELAKDLDWHNNFVWTSDAGDDLFFVTYDLESGTFSDFGTTGIA